MKNSILIGLLLLALGTVAQSYDSTAWKYASTIKAEDLSKHLHVLASDEYEGRATGKKGQKMAMRYLIDQFKSFGIEDYNNLSYNQSFGLIEQENKGIEVIVSTDTFKLNSDFLFNPAIVKNERIKKDLVFVGYGIADSAYNSFENIDIENKVVFFLNENPDAALKEKWDIERKVKWMEEKGAKGVMYYDEQVPSLLKKYEHYFKKARMKLAREEESDFFSVRMSKEMAEIILRQGGLKLKKVEKGRIKRKDQFEIPLEINIDKPTSKLSGENVLAYIPGSSKKEELIVLTAHYDHLGKEDSLVYNGADDDGTGTSTLIELAQAFQQAVNEGNGPKRSILIMPVSGEEKGLLGSKYYTDNPVFPLKNTVANLNIDMIGRYDEAHKNDSNYVYIIGSDKLSTDLHELSERVNKTYMNFNLDYTFNAEDDPNRFYYRSDHYNFAKNDVPVIFYFSGVHEDYHKATDTVDKIDFNKTERIAKLVFLTAWHLANAKERIKLDEK